MITFPQAKINLGLQILSKRADGYHEIASCFYPVAYCDILEIIPGSADEFTTTGLPIPGDPSDNLCLRALELLREDHQIPPVNIHLHKVIPMGAGLGGGSSDGANALKLLNDLFQLDLSADDLQEYASRLGSDCPFFITGQPVLASGTGTLLAPASVSLEGTYIVIVHPGIHISTQEAYSGVVPNLAGEPLDTLLNDTSGWRGHLINDFEKGLSTKYPEIASIIKSMYESGAFYAAMTGSGSAVFGLFHSPPPELSFPDAYSAWKGKLD